MAAEIRTAPQVQKLVDAIKDDIAEAVEHLQRGSEVVRKLEGATKGVNGLSAFLKAQGNTLVKMVEDMASEAADVERKMLGTGKEPIVSTVNEQLSEKVKHAKVSA